MQLLISARSVNKQQLLINSTSLLLEVSLSLVFLAGYIDLFGRLDRFLVALFRVWGLGFR